ncbi:hypothetical protein XENOCAPTIV_016912 [Xenoophorus captivus]|uniref:Uncharacterized protein n=1 Tax=Xenoophorus captivus TaxID=1517983 RepID=A0ABV0RZY6_9TELE
MTPSSQRAINNQNEVNIYCYTDKRVPRYFYPLVVNPIMFNPNLKHHFRRTNPHKPRQCSLQTEDALDSLQNDQMQSKLKTTPNRIRSQIFRINSDMGYKYSGSDPRTNGEQNKQ